MLLYEFNLIVCTKELWLYLVSPPPLSQKKHNNSENSSNNSEIKPFFVSGLPSDDVKWTVNDPTSWPNVTYEDLVDYLGALNNPKSGVKERQLNVGGHDVTVQTFHYPALSLEAQIMTKSTLRPTT